MSDKQAAWAWAHQEKRQNWATPIALFREIERRFALGGRFTIDCAAEPWNAKVERYITAEQDALVSPWGDPRAPGVGFLNPPFDRIGAFVARAAWAVQVGQLEQQISLIPMRTDRRWWEEVIRRYARRVETIQGRVEFEPPPGFDGKVSSHGEPMALVFFEPPLRAAVGWTPQAESLGPLFEALEVNINDGE